MRGGDYIGHYGGQGSNKTLAPHTDIGILYYSQQFIGVVLTNYSSLGMSKTNNHYNEKRGKMRLS